MCAFGRSVKARGKSVVMSCIVLRERRGDKFYSIVTLLLFLLDNHNMLYDIERGGPKCCGKACG